MGRLQARLCVGRGAGRREAKREAKRVVNQASRAYLAANACLLVSRGSAQSTRATRATRATLVTLVVKGRNAARGRARHCLRLRQLLK